MLVETRVLRDIAWRYSTASNGLYGFHFYKALYVQHACRTIEISIVCII